VESIPTSKCDGVALWLDSSSPVIGMSIQNDRIDSFFHTLMHELSHIKHRDECSLDADIRGHAMLPLTVKPKMEIRADADAANWLVPGSELKSFINRVGPLYSKQKIVGFARRIKVHEGIVVGQLQFRGEIGYHANRDLLEKIRNIVISSALTDGYGNIL